MKNIITIEDIDRWGACRREKYEKYSDKKLSEILNGREGLTPLEVLKCEEIDAADRVWAVLREEVIGGDLYFRAGIEIATSVVKRYCLGCGVELVEQWAEKWIAGDISEESAARVAARFATDEVDVAIFAARGAAREASRDAAGVAGLEAWAEGGLASDAITARAAERENQVKILIKLLEGV